MTSVDTKGQEHRPLPVTVDVMPLDMDREIERAIQARKALDKLFDKLLEPGTDYDRIPGTDKPTLLKPGAELLCKVFHLAPGRPEMVSCQEDFQNGIFSYTVCVPIYHLDSGMVVAYGIGAANSKEPKYRYRRSKEDRELRTENPDPAGDQNTLVKMAAKRAFIDGVLKATGASRKFTQDAEDLLPPEKASTKQIDYIKSLFRGKKDDEIIAAIGEILGREVAGWEGITREEASHVIDARKAETPKQTASEAPKQKGKSEGNGIKWDNFWTSAKNLGFDSDQVHGIAGEVFGVGHVESLKDVVKTQADLNKLLNALAERLNR